MLGSPIWRGYIRSRPKYAPKLRHPWEKSQVKATFGVVCKTVVAGLADLVLILRARYEHGPLPN